MTDTDDVDKKKIKIEEPSDEIATQANQQQPTAHGQESPQNLPPSQANQQQISTENAQNLSLSSEANSVAAVSLPATVITTPRHRMITTTGQIR